MLINLTSIANRMDACSGVSSTQKSCSRGAYKLSQSSARNISVLKSSVRVNCSAASSRINFNTRGMYPEYRATLTRLAIYHFEMIRTCTRLISLTNGVSKTYSPLKSASGSTESIHKTGSLGSDNCRQFAQMLIKDL